MTSDFSKWKVDLREPQEMIDRFPGADVTTLDVGDYLYDNQVGFERKAGDFLNFERTLGECTELSLAYPFHFLVVEGTLPQVVSQASKIYSRPMLMPLLGMCASLAVRGVPPIFCGKQEFMVLLMERVAVKCLDDKSRMGWRSIRTRPDMSNEDITANMLVGLPGLGKVKARSLVEKFGSGIGVFEVLIHEPDKILDVDGIGKGTLELVEGWRAGVPKVEVVEEPCGASENGKHNVDKSSGFCFSCGRRV